MFAQHRITVLPKYRMSYLKWKCFGETCGWARSNTSDNRFARFIMVQHTKTGKLCQLTIKYTKLPQNTYIDQMAIKYTNIFHYKILQIYPNWDFWFENIPSGNPDTQVKCKIIWLIWVRSKLQEGTHLPLLELDKHWHKSDVGRDGIKVIFNFVYLMFRHRWHKSM
jgi:hypothetical protein